MPNARDELYDYATAPFKETGAPEIVQNHVNKLIAARDAEVLREAADAVALDLHGASLVPGRDDYLKGMNRALAVVRDLCVEAEKINPIQPVDFFQPGRTYEHSRWVFRCDAITTHPETGKRTALGWFRFSRNEWRQFSATDAEWNDGWADITGDQPAP